MKNLLKVLAVAAIIYGVYLTYPRATQYYKVPKENVKKVCDGMA